MRAIAAFLALAGTARAAAAPIFAPSPMILTSTTSISGIYIHRLNVFDPTVPGEDWWPFRMADKIHFMTREQVIRRELLLKPGDPWRPLDALQSERNLRSLDIFRRAEIAPLARPDGKLDLDVRTQDSWTTNVQFSAGTEGGDNYIAYGFSEDNLLGYDKSVSVQHSQFGPRRRNEFRYDDPRFLGSGFALSPFYARTDHGDSFGTSLIEPFLTLETPYAMETGWQRTVDETILYADGDTSTKFLQRSRSVTGSWGARLESESSLVRRLEAGWYSESQEFTPTQDTTPGTLPKDRELSGPVAGFSWVQPRYVKETYINKMERVEDFNMGNEFYAFGGFMGEALGSDRDRWIFNAIDQQGLYLAPGRFLLSQVGVTGRTARARWENAILFANLNLFWKSDWLYPQTWVAHLETNRGRNLDLENQVILGGDTGLRGYKNNSFTGGKSVLLNLENRFFFPGEYFHLVRFGGVVFFDSGAVAPETVGIGWNRFRSDIGAGLRFGSTRSQSGNVVRMDLAYALEHGPGPSRWVVSVRGRQAFQIFDSSTRRVRQSPGSQLYVQPSQ